MKKMRASYMVFAMFIILLGHTGKALCATPQQQYSSQPNQEDQLDDENQLEDEQNDIAPLEQQQYPQRPNQESQRQYEKYSAPPGTLFKRIAIGMSLKHVIDLIGPPNDTREYLTGKSFIPFYMGTDNVRLEALYKWQGRITFTGRPLTVYSIVNNPNESGYNE